MPLGSDSKRLQTLKRESVTPSARLSLNRHRIVSRAKALRRLKRLLGQEEHVSSEVLELMCLFDIQADELTELGISYEMVRAVERQYLLWSLP